MLPFAFEWHWDIGHFVFMGLFYLALVVITIGIKYCVLATMKDIAIGKTYHHHGHGEQHAEGHGEAKASA